MLTDLYVYDKATKTVHKVGTDPHDSLSVIDGVVVYENLQNGEGTYSGKGDYMFINSECGIISQSASLKHIEKRKQITKSKKEYIAEGESK